MKTVPVSDIEKQLRVLQKKLRRSEKERSTVEDLLDMNQLLYKKLHEEIEVARKTIEVAHNELQKTQRQLIQAEKLASLGQLTAGIAHEIKNPLNFINNFAELNEELEQELLQSLVAFPKAHGVLEHDIQTLRENTRLIGHHGKRADGIVSSMMQHAAKGTGHREQVDVNKLVCEYTELAKIGRDDEKIDARVLVDIDSGEDVGTIEIVKQDLGRVILNVLANAFEALRERAEMTDQFFQAEIRISTRKSGGFVTISIEDNGCGIPEELRPKIFEPFFSTKPTGIHTGLSLSLCHDIVTQGYGGTINVESAVGKGSLFRINLPCG